MKLIYVAGIEHCGSTLTDYLLSRHPRAVGLGEVAAFFSPGHMKLYLEQWGDFPDARTCSCGKAWADCEFWSGLLQFNGSVSKAPMVDKYAALSCRVRELYGDDAIAIDSSKSLAGLGFLAENIGLLGLSRDDLLAVLAIKDVRSFAASMLRKDGAPGSLRATYNVFSRWLFRNGQFLAYFAEQDCRYYINLYEKLCAYPEQLSLDVYGLLGAERDVPAAGLRARTHIAMGNKKFVAEFDGKVRYDSGWRDSNRIKLIYLLHRRVRNLNKRLYSMVGMAAHD